MTTQMIESQERVEEFKQEIADMRLRDPATGRDRRLLQLSVVLFLAAIVIEVVAYTASYNGNDLEQRDAIVLAIGGLVAAVIGAALFVRYSFARFLRYWLARLTYEQQAQTDRIVEAASRD